MDPVWGIGLYQRGDFSWRQLIDKYKCRGSRIVALQEVWSLVRAVTYMRIYEKPCGWQDNYPWDNYPWDNYPWDNYPWDNYPWDKYPWDNYPWINYPWDNYLWDNYPGDNYPGDNYLLGQLSLLLLPTMTITHVGQSTLRAITPIARTITPMGKSLGIIWNSPTSLTGNWCEYLTVVGIL